jgi:putative FmdB family regulatory protein
MPIYEYRCLECRKKFEKIVLGADVARRRECPHCRGTRVEKLVSRFATAMKGGGDDFDGGPQGGFGGDNDAGDDFGGDEGFGEDGFGSGKTPWGPGSGDEGERDDSGHLEHLDDGDGEDDD